MAQLLSGKVAIVTGASSGIGRATTVLFAREGASVVVAGRRRAALDELVSEIAQRGGRAAALPGDVTDEDFAQALVERATREFGGVDVALNNAATLGDLGVSVPDLPRSKWDEILARTSPAPFSARSIRFRRC